MEYKRLGDYIKEINVRNRDLKVTKPMGINIDKHFMPSVANVIGTDLSVYKLVSKNQFACNLMHVGRDEKIPMAMLTDDNPIIVSPAYLVFEIIQPKILMPEYLMMWFSRSEFDRNAWFYTDGDVRGGMDKEAFMDMQLPIPSITCQREIVSEYQTVEQRIQNNEQLIKKLEETAQAIYNHTFVEGIDEENLPKGWRKDILSSLGQTITGSTPSSDSPEDFGNQIMFLTPVDFHEYTKYILSTERCLSELGYNKLKNRSIPPYSVIVTCIGSDMSKVGINTSVCISNQQINSIIPFKYFYTDYLYYCLNSKQELLKAYASGSSTMPLLNKSQFQNIEIVIPKEDILIKFSESISKINNYMQILAKESNHLNSLLSLLTSKLS